MRGEKKASDLSDLGLESGARGVDRLLARVSLLDDLSGSTLGGGANCCVSGGITVCVSGDITSSMNHSTRFMCEVAPFA